MESLEGSPHMVADDGSVAEKSAISQWGRFFEEGGRVMGRTFMVIDEGLQRKAMEEAGFVDIGEWDFKVSRSCMFFLSPMPPFLPWEQPKKHRGRHVVTILRY